MHREHANHRAKLAHHRLIARALKTRPDLVEEAREVVGSWRSGGRQAPYVAAWERVLAQPVDEVRRTIVQRDPEAELLRSSSPFALTPTQVATAAMLARFRRPGPRTTLAR